MHPQKTILLAGNSELVIFGFRAELVRRLIAEGYRVVTAFPVTEFGNGRETARLFGCEYREIRINGHGKNPFEDATLFFRFLTLLRREKPDAVLTFTIKPNIYAGLAARLLGIPYIANITGVGVAIETKSPVRTVAAALYRAALKKPTAVFFQNEDNLRLFETLRIVPQRRLLLPGSGVNLTAFAPLVYPDSQNGIHFVFIARIMRQKGIRYYLDAAKALRSRRSDVYFHILGAMSEPEYEPEIRALEAEGIVHYHGLVKDVREYLRFCHCVVHPTYYPEGMSNVLLEAFASARPAIATDRAGCREIVDDGINGYLCRERDTESLITALEAFLALTDAQRARMGENARRKAQQQFDRETVVSRYLEEIRLATDTHPAHTPSPAKDGAIQTAPPKITFVTGCMVRGGAERILSVLANHYARAGFTVDILQLLKNRSDYPLEASVRVLDFSDGGSRLAFLKWRGRIRRYLRDEHPLAVVSFMARINAAVGLICRKGKGYRLVMSERNDPICDKRGFFINLLLRRAYRRCDEVVFQTAYARSFAGRFCAGGGRIIPNPVQIDKQLLNEPLRTPNAAKRILSAGRFKAQKNQKLLIEAFRLFHEKCPDYTLTIYGFGELKQTLERQIVHAGLSDCVFLLPDTPRLHEEMRNADIFALSSDYEGLSNALLEAMCLGLAVVSTDCSGISEYIENGVNGLLVPVGDAAAFAACLTQLAQEDGLRQTLAQNAMKIRRRVSAEAVFAQWDEVILGSARQETDKNNTAAAFENRTESEEARR